MTRVVAEWRRAKGEVRRFIRKWGLCFLWTLTYRAAASSWTAVVADLRRFFEDIQGVYGRLPLIAVIERGRRNTRRLHVHFAVDRWLDHGLVADVWGRGFVHVGDPGKMPGQVGARKLAGYLSKYLAKQGEAEASGDGDRPDGAHRYLRTQCGTNRVIRAKTSSYADALAELMKVYGLADGAVAFGLWEPGDIHGVWFTFPDGALWHVEPP